MFKNKSFTLIELLVVIVIIGILASVIIISTSSSISKANFAKAKAFSANIKDAMFLDLVSEWTFDEPEENGKTKDGWGVNHGTLGDGTNSNTFPNYKTKESGECVFGGCYSFDGGDYIDCGSGDSLSIKDEITINVWVNPQKITGWDKFVSKFKQSPLDISWFFGFDETDKIAFYLYQVTNSYSPKINFVSTNSIQLNQWYHIVAVFNGTTVEVYLNGNKMSGTLNGSISGIAVSNQPIIIGKDGDGCYFNGSIDNVRIYNVALSSAQIKKNYVAGLNSLLANGNISKQEYNQRINNLSQK